MQRPHERHGEGKIDRLSANPIANARKIERSTDNTECQQRADQVNRQIPEVIAASVQPSERVVHGKRKIDDRPPCH
jgi:hypothetical protein